MSNSIADFLAAEWLALSALLLFIFIVINGARSILQDRELSKNGEVAVASILTQKNRISVNGGGHSRLTYSFEDTHGIKYQGACTDNSRGLFKGMSFLVFYDRDLPMRRVASCESHFEIVLPNEVGLNS